MSRSHGVRIEELNFAGVGNERPPMPMARAMVQQARRRWPNRNSTPGRSLQQMQVSARVRFAPN